MTTALGQRSGNDRVLPSYVQASRSALADVMAWRRGEPSNALTYRAMRALHRRTAGATSRAMLAALRLVPGAPDVRARPTPLDPSWRPSVEALSRQGIAYLPSLLDPQAVERLRTFATSAPADLRLADGRYVMGTYDGRPEDAKSVRIRDDFVLDHPDVQALIADARVHEVARRHFGAGPVVQFPSLYWSCGGAVDDLDVRLMLARRYHWDYDGLRGLRVHLYLTDVDERAAPMRYVAGSHRIGAYRSAALRWADLGVATEEVWRTFDRRAERTLVGPAGTAFVSDSGGLHSGSDPIGRDRLFLVLPMQATGFAGYQLRARSVVPRDAAFTAALRENQPELRLFRARRTLAA